MSDFPHDVRYAFRTFRRTPGLTFVIVVSLAIGIGATTAIFSVVNALLLEPLPYPNPDRLAVLWLRSPGINIPQDWPSPGEYIDVKNGFFREFRDDALSITTGRVNSVSADVRGHWRTSADLGRRDLCALASLHDERVWGNADDAEGR